MNICIKQRDEGSPKVAVNINCYYSPDTDEVVTLIDDGNGKVIEEIRTKR